MPSQRFLSPLVCGLLGAAALGCGAREDGQDVNFSAAQPIGRWQSSAAGATTTAIVAAPVAGRASASTSAGPGPASPGTAPIIGTGTLGSGTLTASAGAPATAVAGRSAGVAGAVANVGAGGTGTIGQAGRDGVGALPAAGSSGGAAGSPGAAAVASLSFDVTTSPAGFRYQPKNIGAIWVQDASGKLVKSLEVWAGIRRRYLTRYVSALSGGTVDVTSSATLSNHKTHKVMWNLKDRNGAQVPPGKYTLVMEMTDGDISGRSNAVEIDTSGGAMSLTPMDAPSFSGMTLQLQ